MVSGPHAALPRLPQPALPPPQHPVLGKRPHLQHPDPGTHSPSIFPTTVISCPCGWKGHPYQASGFMSCPLGWVLWQAAARPRCPELLLMTLLLGNPGGTPLATTLKINFVKYLLARVLHLPLRNSSDLDSGLLFNLHVETPSSAQFWWRQAAFLPTT